MPNMNPQFIDCPLDYNSKTRRELLIDRKLHAVLQAAASVDADVLVIPDLGCKDYGNDPETMGAAFGRVLYSYPGLFYRSSGVWRPRILLWGVRGSRFPLQYHVSTAIMQHIMQRCHSVPGVKLLDKHGRKLVL